MSVEAVTPKDYQVILLVTLNRRRGIVLGMEDTVAGNVVKAEVPLAEMFGYSTTLRSMSQGRATYTMEFTKYSELPSNVGIINKTSVLIMVEKKVTKKQKLHLLKRHLRKLPLKKQ